MLKYASFFVFFFAFEIKFNRLFGFVKLISRPIQVNGKSKVDSWLKPPLHKAHSASRVSSLI